MQKQIVHEGCNLSVPLYSETEAPFPPIKHVYFEFDGRNVTSNNKIFLKDGNLIILMAERNMSGYYTVYLTNTVEQTVNASFLLDVQCKLA